MSSILRSSKFVRYFFGLARSIITNRLEVDGGLNRSQHLTGLISNNFSTNLSSLQSVSPLEQTVRQLDEEARRTGRVSITELEEAFNSIKGTRKATASQSLMIIRCCGNLVPEETPEQRTKLVEEIWKTFQKLGVPLDISHYNALLKVYLENEHKFSPAEFLAKLEANGIEPNRVTYQRLIAGFCQQGDIAGATQILGFMKDKQIPVSEGVFNALILGHSKNDDMQSAEGILTVMRQANLEPSNETYATLLSGYAARGDAEAVERVLTECKLKDVLLSDRDYLEIVYTAAVNGHDQLTDKILKNIRHSMGYNQDAANVIIRLITVGKDEAAYKVFLTMNPAVRSTDTSLNMSGHIMIKHLVKANRSVEQLLSWCERLKNDGHTDFGLWIAVDASFHHNNIQLTLDLLREFKKRGEPIRHHYFWPSLATAGKANDLDRMKEVVKVMIDEFQVSPTSETMKDYFLPYLPRSLSPDEIINMLDDIGVKRGQAVVALTSYLINKNRLKEAVELARQGVNLNYKGNVTTRQLIDALKATNDIQSTVALLQVFHGSGAPITREDKDEDGEEEGEIGDDFVTRFLFNIVSYAPTQKFLLDILKEMLELGLPVSNSCAEILENKMQGKASASEVSELLAKLSSGTIVPQPVKRSGSATPFVKTPASLLRIKEKMLYNNEPAENLISINRSLYQLYCHEGDVENALKIKQELDEKYKIEESPGIWANLLDAYCIQNDLENAKKCLEKIKMLSADFELDPDKILNLARLYVQNNQLEEAENLLNSVKSREREISRFIARNNAWRLLQAVAETHQDPEKVKKMLNLMVARKFVEVSNVMLGPIIKASLVKDDLAGALKDFEECVKLHRATPFKSELTMRFIEKEDAANLQTVVDLSTEVHGEVNSLYDLVLSFIESGKIRQARKVLETPGLTSRNTRLLSACERYKKEGQAVHLEGLVEATKDVPLIDRSEIYKNLLDTYCEADEVEKALGLWTKMQDEDVNVTDEFLITLGQFLKKKGLEVPFQIPTSASEKPTSTEKTEKPNATEVTSRSPLLTALLRKDADKALQIKDEMASKGEKLSRPEVNRLLELLVEQNRFRDATSLLVTAMTDNPKLPTLKTLNFLFSRLASAGEIDLMNRLDTVMSEDLRRLTSFSNRRLSAAVVAGKSKEELDKIEKEIDSATNSDDIDEVAHRFPRGGVLSVLENSPSDYEQVARIADKFYAKGSVTPGNCLMAYHLAQGDLAKAQELFRKYNLKNCSQFMFRNVINKARDTQDAKLLEGLLSMMGEAPAISPEAKGLIYSNLISINCSKEQYDTAEQKLEEALKTLPLELIHTTTLTSLKNGLEANNKTFKYTIPPRRRQKESSSSSSSSETEQKKSAASN